MLMDLALPALLLLGVGLLWHSALGAREAARRHARRLCAAANLQLLDETVSLERMRPQRDDRGGWSWRRTYAFEVSSTGSDRLRGSLHMLGESLRGSSMPSNSSAEARTDRLI